MADIETRVELPHTFTSPGDLIDRAASIVRCVSYAVIIDSGPSPNDIAGALITATEMIDLAQALEAARRPTKEGGYDA